jgi:hypothetical protein
MASLLDYQNMDLPSGPFSRQDARKFVFDRMKGNIFDFNMGDFIARMEAVVDYIMDGLPKPKCGECGK